MEWWSSCLQFSGVEKSLLRKIKQMGYIEEVFQDAENHSCPICQGIIESARQCPRGHSFCEGCLSAWLEKSDSCPYCRITLTTIEMETNSTLDTQIKELLLKCPVDQLTIDFNKNPNISNHNINCKWVGCLKDLAAHYPEGLELIKLPKPELSTEEIYIIQHNKALFFYHQKDYTRAFEYFRLSASQNFSPAIYDLGNCYFDGLGIIQNYEKALELYEKAAENGDEDAEYMAGFCFYNGRGCVKDFVKSFMYYERSALQGHPKAMCALGTCYYKGNGCEKQDYEKAKYWYEESANHGYAVAQFSLGSLYYNGHGVAEDFTQAARFYELSADQGYAGGLCGLGTCYYKGLGVQKDFSKAYELYKKSAEKNYDVALYSLGILYYKGHGCEQDYKQSFDYYQKAAIMGYASAQCGIGTCYYNGQGTEVNFQEAFKWYLAAAEQGNDRAQYSLGTCYFTGNGCDQNYKMASVYYKKAADQGNEGAGYWYTVALGKICSAERKVLRPCVKRAMIETRSRSLASMVNAVGDMEGVVFTGAASSPTTTESTNQK